MLNAARSVARLVGFAGATAITLQAAAAWAVIAPGDLLVADFGIDAIVRVDPATGDRTVISGAGVGSGVSLLQPRGVAVDSTGRIFVSDATLQAVLRIDAVTGQRTIISSAGVGSGPSLVAPAGLADDGAGGLLVADLSLDAVFRVDKLTGARAVASGAMRGSGPLLGHPAVVGVAPDGRALVGDQALDALLAFDLATGDRVAVSGAGVGSGPAFASPVGLALDGAAALVADSSQAILRVDLASGVRTTHSGAARGAGPAFADIRGVAAAPSGIVFAVDEDLDAVLRVDAAGNRSILSSAAAGAGGGPTFVTPEAIALVGLLVPEPSGLVLAAVGLLGFSRWRRVHGSTHRPTRPPTVPAGSTLVAAGRLSRRSARYDECGEKRRMIRTQQSFQSWLRSCLPAALAAAVMSVAVAPASAGETRAPGDRVSFNEHIRPIFVSQCVSCHGGVKQLSGLSFIYREQALAEAESGQRAIVPGSAAESYLIERVSDPDPDFRMPPAEHGPALTAREIDLLARWIDQGAEWEEHWAFIAPKKHEPPNVKNAVWPRDPIDQFVLARVEAAGLAPSPEADRATWLRRASLDLTGMPPTPEEYATFAADAPPTAYARAADRLLASPRFGERWASMWLDLARYADTQGFEKDDHRNAWPYRDWVIRALNDDMPFDEFTVKQLAGDLLPEATLADRVATAFHRNTQTNAEGGTDDEEFRTAAVLDRVGTTWEAWMGATFRCAQCHDHPYEPIRHREFYEFVAFFNTSRDVDVDADLPLVAVPNDLGDWREASELDCRISELRQTLHARASELVENASLWQPMTPTVVSGTGQTKLAVREVDGVAEVVADGAVSARSTFTLRFSLPEGVSNVAAVRIDALPKDVAAALKTAEMGFVVTRITGRIVAADGNSARDVNFVAAYADEPEPVFDPEDSLRDNDYGWGEYTRMSRARHAAFVLEEAAPVQAGDQLELTIQFNQTATGDIALAIERGRYSVSASSQWQDLERAPETVGLKRKLAEARQRRGQIPHTNLPVMAEQAESYARETYTFTRGNWLDKGEHVDAGVPQVFPELPEGARADRLAMARWIVSPENPLTARVLVNRLWQELFGVGLVETAEDFGSSGLPPSHPELLDHLALRFQSDMRWSVKQLLRAMVLSAAYRQNSDVTAESLAADPRNRLLARGPRTRLTAEMVRDQALALSGRFSPKMFGPPVMPPQPDGVWRSVYNGAVWKTAEGDDRYRRAVYTYWKRTSGYPSMLTFDAPSRDVCVARRIATNTPLQALAAMNDDALVELAQGFAQRMAEAGDDPAEQIAAGYEQATGQPCPEPKRLRLEELYAKGAAAYDAAPESAGKLASSREQYALVIVANAILNLDEVLTK